MNTFQVRQINGARTAESYDCGWYEIFSKEEQMSFGLTVLMKGGRMFIVLFLTAVLFFIIIRKILKVKEKPFSFEAVVLFGFRELGIGAAIFAAGSLLSLIVQHSLISQYVNIVTYLLVLAFMIESAYVLHSYYKRMHNISLARLHFPKLESIQPPPATEEQVFNAIMSHAEIVEFLERMDLLNQKVCLTINEEKNYWLVHVFEDHPTHIATYGFFKIDKSTGKITPDPLDY
jgi:hypothetical protein